ncbi:MAG TPA: PucR family transcriptional regulator ligand-binding domain-containing protein [Actinomycetales bacterium]|nr:PucR family transcriptional regulator ligand-binding domain-containing protein [Actinomycetales bacterium]
MRLPTIRDVLTLPDVQRGHPEVVAAPDRLDRAVRWVHVVELVDVEGLLQGGELVLTTGVALPDDADGLRAYVRSLVDNGAAGLVVELGERWQAPPGPLVKAAESADLPVVVLHTPVRFVAITEAVHATILSAQHSELTASEQLHQVFTRLGVEGADVQEILEEAAVWAAAPVVLESPAHRVLAVATGGRDRQAVLSDWEQRSRRVAVAGTGVGGPEPWLVTGVGARGRSWGRLVLQPDGAPTSRQRMVLERAASALALNRLIERDEQSLERVAHQNVLTDLVARRQSEEDLHALTAALGVPTRGRTLIGAVVRARPSDPERVFAVAKAVERSRSVALVAPFAGGTGILLTVEGPSRREPALRRLAEYVHRQLAEVQAQAVIGVGGGAETFAEAATSLAEAAQVAEAADTGRQGDGPGSGTGYVRDRPYLELADVRLRGLLALLGDDARLQVFVERELGPLLSEGTRSGEELLRTLTGYLEAGRNKSAAAENLHLSRPAFYHRMQQLEQLLDVDLDDVDSCLSLHVAVTALQMARSRAQAHLA